MPTTQIRENSRVQHERPNYGEVTYAQYKDLQGRIDRVEKELDRVNIRLDRIENRMDKLDTKIDDTRKELDTKIDDVRKGLDAKIDKLADKIDALHNEIKSSTNHGQIATISTLGIAVAVIYSLLR